MIYGCVWAGQGHQASDLQITVAKNTTFKGTPDRIPDLGEAFQNELHTHRVIGLIQVSCDLPAADQAYAPATVFIFNSRKLVK